MKIVLEAYGNIPDKIGLIKTLRYIYKLSLKDAKDVADSLVDKYRAEFDGISYEPNIDAELKSHKVRIVGSGLIDVLRRATDITLDERRWDNAITLVEMIQEIDDQSSQRFMNPVG